MRCGSTIYVGVAISPAQKEVATYRGGDLQMIACAGSGKTESVSRQVAAPVEEGAEPASIVAFTSTEGAATELKARVVRRVSERIILKARTPKYPPMELPPDDESEIGTVAKFVEVVEAPPK